MFRKNNINVFKCISEKTLILNKNGYFLLKIKVYMEFLNLDKVKFPVLTDFLNGATYFIVQ